MDRFNRWLKSQDIETHHTLSIVTGEVIPVEEVKERYVGEDFYKSINPVKNVPKGVLEVVEGEMHRAYYNTKGVE